MLVLAELPSRRFLRDAGCVGPVGSAACRQRVKPRSSRKQKTMKSIRNAFGRTQNHHRLRRPTSRSSSELRQAASSLSEIPRLPRHCNTDVPVPEAQTSAGDSTASSFAGHSRRAAERRHRCGTTRRGPRPSPSSSLTGGCLSGGPAVIRYRSVRYCKCITASAQEASPRRGSLHFLLPEAPEGCAAASMRS